MKKFFNMIKSNLLYKEYYSCSYVRTCFNFYRSNKITSCCFTEGKNLLITDISDTKSTLDQIIKYQNNLINLHKTGNAPQCCKDCVNFKKQKWPDKVMRTFSNISLNHFKICNLNCTHCGYKINDPNEFDSDDKLVLLFLKDLYDMHKFDKKMRIDVGGGEPSINQGIDEILKFCIDKNISVHINSNGARYSPTFTEGINKGLFVLYLTPDAGSNEVYMNIKNVKDGVFDNTWNNIKRYLESTKNSVYVKFIIEAGNKNDVKNMIEKSKEVCARNLVLSFDLNICQE